MIIPATDIPADVGFCKKCIEPVMKVNDLGWCPTCVDLINGIITKILFLDVDGVLNDVATLEADGVTDMHPAFVRNLGRILQETECRIVVSSAWRLGGIGPTSDFQKALMCACTGKDRFTKVTNALAGRTPHLPDGHRGSEIKEWIEKYDFKGTFVIVDDEGDMQPYTDRLVKTLFSGPEGKTGLTTAHADRIIAMLNRRDEWI